jgi:hypothetical protein
VAALAAAQSRALEQDRLFSPVAATAAGAAGTLFGPEHRVGGVTGGNSAEGLSVPAAFSVSAVTPPPRPPTDFFPQREETIEIPTQLESVTFTPMVELPTAPVRETDPHTWTDQVPEAGVLGATGLVATAGYVLLNTRAASWLLSLLSARPVWKQFDPLEVIYAWEEEEKEQGAGEESLLSLVEAAE